MGLFSKFFKPENKEANQKVRAQFKDEKYFIGQIDRCNRFMKNDGEDFELFIQKNGKLEGSHYLTAAQIRNKKIENAYSKGEKIEEIIPVYDDSFNWFIQGFSDDYQGYPLLLQMVSFTVLFDASNEKFKMLSDFCNKLYQSNIEEIWKPDSLVFFLLGETDKKRKGIEPYEKLYQITQLPKEKAEEAIGNYLKEWYNNHRDQPWYNTHLREKGYSGYWAWEVAAMVKLLQLNDESFKDNPFYPYDMVHWVRN